MLSNAPKSASGPFKMLRPRVLKPYQWKRVEAFSDSENDRR